jgi:Ribbon-helix-helix protein, copG family
MKRTQLYLDDDMWKALHIRSRQSRTPISELVRQAVRDKYGNPLAHRRRAMQAWVGLWRDRSDLRDSETYVRQLRKGERLRRIAV